MTTTQQGSRPRARIGTIVWGAILVGIAVFALIALLGGPLSPTAVLWSVVGFGAALLIAAVVAAIVRAAREALAKPATGAPTPESASNDGGHPPIG
ncbi:MAG: hypothetical protein WDM88_02830 [Galbitalea sp.]